MDNKHIGAGKGLSAGGALARTGADTLVNTGSAEHVATCLDGGTLEACAAYRAEGDLLGNILATCSSACFA